MYCNHRDFKITDLKGRFTLYSANLRIFSNLRQFRKNLNCCWDRLLSAWKNIVIERLHQVNIMCSTYIFVHTRKLLTVYSICFTCTIYKLERIMFALPMNVFVLIKSWWDCYIIYVVRVYTGTCTCMYSYSSIRAYSMCGGTGTLYE